MSEINSGSVPRWRLLASDDAHDPMALCAEVHEEG
jgi:hypothetical protein